MFANLKFMHLMTKHNPQMSEFFRDLDPETRVDLQESKMRIAFTLEDYYEPRRLKNDPKYVKWIFLKTTQVAGETIKTSLPIHKCTDEDYEDFYPTELTYQQKLETIREDPNRGFYCADLGDSTEIWGTE